MGYTYTYTHTHTHRGRMHVRVRRGTHAHSTRTPTHTHPTYLCVCVPCTHITMIPTTPHTMVGTTLTSGAHAHVLVVAHTYIPMHTRMHTMSTHTRAHHASTTRTLRITHPFHVCMYLTHTTYILTMCEHTMPIHAHYVVHVHVHIMHVLHSLHGEGDGHHIVIMGEHTTRIHITCIRNSIEDRTSSHTVSLSN